MKYLFVSLLLSSVLFAKPIRFAPLPMDIAPKLHTQYSNMLEYLTKETGLEFEFVYCANYEEIIQKFQNQEIEVAELGPLPYLKLAKTIPTTKPLLTFLTPNGDEFYRCQLFTFDDNINHLSDLHLYNPHIFLTSEHSTCGTLMMSDILYSVGKNLRDLNSSFSGTHSNVVLENLLTPNAIGGIKSTVYTNYEHLGLKTLAVSTKIPGFTFAVNTKLLSHIQMKLIQDAILKLKPLQNRSDWEITKKWGKNIRYGAIKPKKDAYIYLKKVWERTQNAH